MPYSDFFILNCDSRDDGKVYIVGDVHGEKSAFDAALEQLRSQDTLIIAGDIIDRCESGDYTPSSAQVLDKIIELNNAEPGTAPRVHAIRGNHEQDFLKVLDIVHQEPAVRNTPDNKKELMRFILNGGHWIFTHPDQEKAVICNERFTHLSYRAKEHFEESMRVTQAFITELLDSTNVNDYLIENVSQYEDYIRTLPFIIKINESDNVAWVAHADLKLSDETLNAMIEKSEGLSEKKRKDITEARPATFIKNERDASSSLVYCGHNVVDNPFDERYQTLKNPAAPVRCETNHINLDVGAYFTKGLVLVNHTEHTASVVGTRILRQDDNYFSYVISTINQFYAQRESLLNHQSLSSQSFFPKEDNKKRACGSDTESLNETNDEAAHKVPRNGPGH